MRKVLYVFGVLNDTDIEWIAEAGARRRVPRDEVLIHEGILIDSIIIMLEGKAAVTVQGAGEVAQLGAGEIIGEISLVDSAPPSATVTATCECLALYIEKATLWKKLEDDVAFGARFYRALAILLADRLRNVERRMAYDGRQSLANDTVLKDEIDLGILDTLSLAGDRFDRMMKVLAKAPG